MDIAAFSQKLAGYLRARLALTTDDEAVLGYSVQMIISGMVSLVAIIIMAWFLGVLKLALASVVTAATMRTFSGGAHSERVFNCAALGVLITPGIALLVKYRLTDIPGDSLFWFYVLTAITAIAAVIKYAPADTPAKPITNPAQRKRLRGISLGLIGIWLVLIVVILGRENTGYFPYLTASALSLIWQSFSITTAGYRAMAGFDRLMPKGRL